MSGISSYGAYVPRFRLDRAEVAAAVGERGAGTRAVAGFDQDATTMGLKAARVAVRAGSVPSTLWFATTAPPYVDKTNATTIHAALDLSGDVGAFDLGATVRSGMAALLTAARTDGLAVLADVRGGLPGGSDERAGGDAAAAFVFSGSDTLAEVVATASASAEFLDRWANPGDVGSRQWEERFGEGEYVLVAERAVDDLLKAAGIAIADVDHVVVAGPNARATRSITARLRKQAGVTAAGKEVADLIGNAGTAAVGLALADALDTAGPDELILVLGLADGADALLLRTTALLAEHRPAAVRSLIEGGLPVSYPA